MTKAELLERLRGERLKWDELIREIPRHRMFEPAINNGWSIKDTIGHVAYYEGWLLNWLEAAVHGKVKVATHQDLLSVDERNALVWQANKDRELDDLLHESQQMSDRLYRLVKTLPERDLADPYRFERYVLPFWNEPRSLYQCIAENSYEHYQEHHASIQAWWKVQQVILAVNNR